MPKTAQKNTDTKNTASFRQKVVYSGGKMESKGLKKAPTLSDGDKDILITESYLPKGLVVPIHWHDYFEYEIILNGSAEHIYNDKKYTVSRGWTYLSSYYDFHAITATEDLRLLNIRFTERLLPDDLFTYLTNRPNRLICKTTEEQTLNTVKMIEQLNIEISENAIFNDIIIKGLLSNLVINLIRMSGENLSTALPPLVQRATAYINTSFRENLKLETTAKALSVTPNYLGYVFKSKLGTSFNEYLNNVRLKYACNLLLSTSLTIKEIAYLSGYNSAEYFLYIFKRKFGISPLGYRKVHKKGLLP